jgi:predicted nucleic acid-binding protein
MRALLDINVLIALHDGDHVHHDRAVAWFDAHIQQGWASSPLTQNGCLRIMSQAAYANPQPLAMLVPHVAKRHRRALAQTVAGRHQHSGCSPLSPRTHAQSAATH